MNIKKGDTILIIKGKDRGKTGKILKTFPLKNKVTVEGLNLYKKSKKPKRQGEKGEIVLISRSMNRSNVMIFCSTCKKPIRTGTYFNQNDKYRICKKCKNKI